MNKYEVGDYLLDDNRNYKIVDVRHTNQYSVNQNSIYKIEYCVEGEYNTTWVSESSIDATCELVKEV